MTLASRRTIGLPVEVALFDADLIKQREAPGGAYARSDSIYSFTLAPDTENDGIFCDSPGQRPGSIAWGITLDPVYRADHSDYEGSSSALYIESTGPELLHLIACLQNLYDVNYDEEGKLRE